MVAGAKLAVENGGGNPGSALLNPALKDDTDDIKHETNGAADLDNKVYKQNLMLFSIVFTSVIDVIKNLKV